MRFRFLALALPVLISLATPAFAKLEICNRTPSPFSVAIAFETDADIISQGWWTVDPDKCATVIEGDLTRQYYYHYVKSTALNVEWAGTFNFCTNQDPQFRISGAGTCEERKFTLTGFRQIDVGTNKDFALDISMAPVAPAAAVTTAPAVAPATTTVITTTTTTTAPAPEAPVVEAVPEAAPAVESTVPTP